MEVSGVVICIWGGSVVSGKVVFIWGGLFIEFVCILWLLDWIIFKYGFYICINENCFVLFCVVCRDFLWRGYGFGL